MNMHNTYQYGYTTESSFDNSVVWILMIYLIFLAVMGIIALVSYILKGIGMHTMAKRQGMETPVLAFIPFARTWMQGELAGKIKLKEKSINSPGIWLLVMPFAYGILYGVSYIIVLAAMFGTIWGARARAFMGSTGLLVMIVVVVLLILITVLYSALYRVLKALVDYQIFGRMTTRNMAVVHAVLSVFIPLYESICFFVMRNRSYMTETGSEETKESAPTVDTAPTLLPVEEVKMPADAEQGTEANDGCQEE